MWTVLSVSFIVVTSIYGITEILRELWLYFLRPKNSPPGFTVLLLKEDIFKEQLRFAMEHLSWERPKNFSGLIVIDTDLSEKSKKELSLIINNNHNIMRIEEASLLFSKN
ncbi:MAG: hypothetical protein IJE01_04365 [Clostridia bacterium]|nr:hypothetical protein [Clostridia bacterium]